MAHTWRDRQRSLGAREPRPALRCGTAARLQLGRPPRPPRLSAGTWRVPGAIVAESIPTAARNDGTGGAETGRPTCHSCEPVGQARERREVLHDRAVCFDCLLTIENRACFSGRRITESRRLAHRARRLGWSRYGWRGGTELP